MTLLKNDDEAAYETLYHRYWGKLFYLAGKKVGDLHEAENIVQDVFLDLWQRRKHIPVIDKLDGYLVVAVKYRVINALARQSRKARFIAGSIAGEADNSTQHWLAFKDLQEWLLENVGQLPEKCGLVFNMRQKGYTQKEIASAMRISEKTVQMHISRALKALRASIGQFLFSLLLTLLKNIF